tara:strand:+ start:1111 stop:1971 length:861 start_codon:yes stop_codon:yes gene_type:complete
MKVLVTGAFGQLGTALIKVLCKKHDVIPTGKDSSSSINGLKLDILNKLQIKEVVSATQPDVIINLASITNVDYCEQKPLLAKEVNIAGVQNICDAFSGKIIQLSTDFVFDGKNGPYHENDPISPISVYGKTKSDAEKLLLDNNPNHLVIRGNVLYSEKYNFKSNFLGWIVNSLKNGTKIKVVNDQFNNPTWTKSMADVIGLCLSSDIVGILHWADADYLSRYEFSKKIASRLGLEISLIKEVETKELQQIARRPLKCGLLADKAMKTLNIIPPTLEECLDKINVKQ